jgi:2-polyprenyl-6-hydroxyphenyl methylase/3-demethylubiquinone-9 3-methyltransferase
VVYQQKKFQTDLNNYLFILLLLTHMKIPKFNNAWPDAWKQLFDKDHSELYDKTLYPGQYYSYQLRLKTVLDFITLNLPVGSKILDLAAAQGNFSLLLAEKGYLVTWNDIRTDIEGYVKLKYEKGVIDYNVENIFDLNEGLKFDCIIACEIIEHLAHPDQLLKKLSRLINVNGIIIITTPNGYYFKNKLPLFSNFPNPEIFEDRQFLPDSDGHIFLLTMPELIYFGEQSHLEILSAKYMINFVTHGHIKIHHLLKFIPYKFLIYFENLLQGENKFLKKKLNSHIFIAYKKL